jgi:exonuclease III
MATMRVVTWNMAYWSHRRHHAAAWRWVIDDLRPDVLLVQEAVIPEWVHERFRVHWTRAYETGQQPWGTGLATLFPFEPARVPALDEWFGSIPDSVPGMPAKAAIHKADNWLACAHVELPGIGRTLLGSVHSPSFPIEKSRLRGVDVSAMKLKRNPDLWFLDVLFYFLRSMLGKQFIVGGDFNSSRLLDTTLGERGNNEFFDRIRGEGFVSLHRLFHDVDERTYFKTGKAPHQLDYLYSDMPAARTCHACAVHQCGEFSDHAPLVADFA